VFCSANTNTPTAQNTAVGIVFDERMIFYDTGFLEDLFKPLGLEAHAEEFGHVLKSALLVGGAVSAIHIMNGEQKPKSASLQASDGRSVGVDNQRPGDPNGAGGNRFSIDFNEAQPARGIRRLHAFKVAEVWDIDALAQACFE
jgi:hypothetical protein